MRFNSNPVLTGPKPKIWIQTEAARIRFPEQQKSNTRFGRDSWAKSLETEPVTALDRTGLKLKKLFIIQNSNLACSHGFSNLPVS